VHRCPSAPVTGGYTAERNAGLPPLPSRAGELYQGARSALTYGSTPGVGRSTGVGRRRGCVPRASAVRRGSTDAGGASTMARRTILTPRLLSVSSQVPENPPAPPPPHASLGSHFSHSPVRK